MSPSENISQSTVLNPTELASLTYAWEIWASSAPTSLRSIARARVHLIFLLIRYGGLRLGEAIAISIPNQLDKQSGLLTVLGDNPRSIIMPAAGLRAIRKILTLPEAQEDSFNKLDPGFIRRTFYSLAKDAGIERVKGGPRAIRYARGIELLNLHTPLNLVQDYLGLRTQAQVAAFLQCGGLEAKGKAIAEKQALYGVRGNAFMTTVLDIESGLNTAFLLLKTLSGQTLSSLCATEDFIKTEPVIGQNIWAFIFPQQIFLTYQLNYDNFSNYLPGQICSFQQDPVESRVAIKLAQDELIEAQIGNDELPNPLPQIGDDIFAVFSARAVSICAN